MSGLLDQVNGQVTRVTAPGSVVIADHQGVFYRLIVPGTYEGTITFYDSSTVAGTAAGNQIVSIGLPTYTTYPLVFEMGIQYRSGLVYAAGGTPTVVIVSD